MVLWYEYLNYLELYFGTVIECLEVKNRKNKFALMRAPVFL